MTTTFRSNRAHLSGSVESNWAQGLLTLISIILGAAVAVGAEKTFTLSIGPGLSSLAIIHAFTAFMFITGCYYHIFSIVSFFFILPSILWVMLPTAVGVGVIMMSYSIGNTKHFLLSAIICYIAGAILYFFSLLEQKFGRIGLLARKDIDTARAHNAFRVETIKNTLCFLFMSCSSGAIYFGNEDLHMFAPLDAELAFIGINGGIYSFMVWRTERKFLPSVRKVWGLGEEVTTHNSASG